MMKFRKVSLLAVLAAISLVSCEKDEDVEIKYMDGSIRLEVPAYLKPGDKLSFNLKESLGEISSVSRDDGGPVGYYFVDPSNSSTRDTLLTEDGEWLDGGLYEYEVPDTLATLSLALVAFGGDYSTSRGSSSFTVVKPGLNGENSVTGFDTGGDATMTDSRDGLEYYVTTIGNTQWMRQNLAWDGTGGEEDKTVGRAYEDCDVMSTIFGRYYTWDEAQSACPPGWRLPEDTDWAALAEKYGETHEPGTDYEGLAGDLLEQTLAFNGTKMWEYWKDVDMTNASRLSVMPVGFANVDDAEYDFDFLYTYAAFWTGDEYGGDLGVVRYVIAGYDLVYWGVMPKGDLAYSVRCVRDL